MSEFGVLIKKVRKEKKLTLEKVAVKVGTHKGYISGIENGKVNPPSVKFIRRIAQVLKLDAKDLVRIAYIDKVPAMIKKEIASALEPAAKLPPFMVKIPMLNHCAAGFPTEVDAKGEVRPLTDTYAVIPKPRYAVDYLLVACDDSMECDDPLLTFPKGAIATVSKGDKPKVGDAIFVVFNRNGGRAAHIRVLQNDEHEKVTLHPLNGKYPDEIVDKDDVDLMYKIIGKGVSFGETKRRQADCVC